MYSRQPFLDLTASLAEIVPHHTQITKIARRICRGDIPTDREGGAMSQWRKRCLSNSGRLLRQFARGHESRQRFGFGGWVHE